MQRDGSRPQISLFLLRPDLTASLQRSSTSFAGPTEVSAAGSCSTAIRPRKRGAGVPRAAETKEQRAALRLGEERCGRCWEQTKESFEHRCQTREMQAWPHFTWSCSSRGQPFPGSR